MMHDNLKHDLMCDRCYEAMNQASIAEWHRTRECAPYAGDDDDFTACANCIHYVTAGPRPVCAIAARAHGEPCAGGPYPMPGCGCTNFTASAAARTAQALETLAINAVRHRPELVEWLSGTMSAAVYRIVHPDRYRRRG